MTLHANAAEWAAKTFGSAPAEEGKNPAAGARQPLQDRGGARRRRAPARAGVADANHFLYLVKANQLAAADPSKIKAPALIVYDADRPGLPPDWIERTAAAIKASGTPVETVAIAGPNGHLNGVLHIAQAGPKIAEFLAK